MDFGARAPDATTTRVGLREKKGKIKKRGFGGGREREKKKNLSAAAFILNPFLQILPQFCDVGEFEVPPCQR